MVLKCLGYGRKGSILCSVTGCAANQGRSAGLDGASAARFQPAKAQKPEQSYSSKSTTSPYSLVPDEKVGSDAEDLLGKAGRPLAPRHRRAHGNRAKGYSVLSSRKPREPLRRPGGALLR